METARGIAEEAESFFADFQNALGRQLGTLVLLLVVVPVLLRLPLLLTALRGLVLGLALRLCRGRTLRRRRRGRRRSRLGLGRLAVGFRRGGRGGFRFVLVRFAVLAHS